MAISRQPLGQRSIDSPASSSHGSSRSDTPTRFLASLNLPLPSRAGLATSAISPSNLASPLSNIQTSSSHPVFTPGLLFSSANKSRGGGNEWWPAAIASRATGRSRGLTGGATGRAAEVNPFEVSLAEAAPSVEAATLAGDSAMMDFGAPVGGVGHARRATISCGSGLTPLLPESGFSQQSALDMWNAWTATGGAAQECSSAYAPGAIDSWIDFSGGHPGSPGQENDLMGGKRGIGDADDAGSEGREKKRVKIDAAVPLDGMQPPRRSLTGETTVSSSPSPKSPGTDHDALTGPSPLTSSLTAGSVETTLTPPLTLDSLASDTSAPALATGTLQERRAKKHEHRMPSRIAPDLSQRVPAFVGVERYSESVCAAPEGARDVVADFLRGMQNGEVGSVPAAIVPAVVDPRAMAGAGSGPGPGVDMEWTAAAAANPGAVGIPPVRVFAGIGHASAPQLHDLVGRLAGPQPLPAQSPSPSPSHRVSAPTQPLTAASVPAHHRNGAWTSREGNAPPNTAPGTFTKKSKPARAVAASQSPSAPSPSHSESSAGNPAPGGIPLTEEQKRRAFLERNRVAACKSRAKKKEWQEALEQRASELTAQNADLQGLVSLMRDEIVSLRGLVASHAACRCGSLKGFVEAGGLGIPSSFSGWGMPGIGGRPAPLGAAGDFVRGRQLAEAQTTAAPATGSPPQLPPSAPLPLGAELLSTARTSASLVGGASLSGAAPSYLLGNAHGQGSRRANSPAKSTATEFAGALENMPARPNSAPPTTPTPGGTIGLAKTQMADYFDKSQ